MTKKVDIVEQIQEILLSVMGDWTGNTDSDLKQATGEMLKLLAQQRDEILDLVVSVVDKQHMPVGRKELLESLCALRLSIKKKV